MKKVLIVTGGSGGHVIPAISIYDHLKNNFEVFLITDERGKRFIDQNKYKFDVTFDVIIKQMNDWMKKNNSEQSPTFSSSNKSGIHLNFKDIFVNKLVDEIGRAHV